MTLLTRTLLKHNNYGKENCKRKLFCKGHLNKYNFEEDKSEKDNSEKETSEKDNSERETSKQNNYERNI